MSSANRSLWLRSDSAAQFSATSALLHYVIGAGAQNATNSRSPVAPGGRRHVLDTIARHWEGLDPEEYAFTRTMTAQLRDHDDRAEFLAGIDFILDGMLPSRPQSRPQAVTDFWHPTGHDPGVTSSRRKLDVAG